MQLKLYKNYLSEELHKFGYQWIDHDIISDGENTYELVTHNTDTTFDDYSRYPLQFFINKVINRKVNLKRDSIRFSISELGEISTLKHNLNEVKQLQYDLNDACKELEKSINKVIDKIADIAIKEKR